MTPAVAGTVGSPETNGDEGVIDYTCRDIATRNLKLPCFVLVFLSTLGIHPTPAAAAAAEKVKMTIRQKHGKTLHRTITFKARHKARRH